MEALAEMMEALTGDRKFTEQIEDLIKKQGEREEIRMCEYIDMLEARGEAIGEARGEARGEAIGETRLSKLIQLLLNEKKYSDIDKATSSREKRHELYRRYGI